MISAGRYHNLRVGRIATPGLYLTEAAGLEDGAAEVLLPNRFVSMADKPGDEKRVFVYHDSEDRLVATTETPLVTVGGFAALKVVDRTDHGAFLDWGLMAKHLFLPNRNQQGGVVVGRPVFVYVYEDSVTGRAVATMKLGGVVSNSEISVRPGDAVSFVVASRGEVGWRVVITGSAGAAGGGEAVGGEAVGPAHWAMLYHNQIYSPVAVGDRLSGFVRRITDDGRIDVALQRQGFAEVTEAADRLRALLRDAGGTLPIGDSSDPADVNRVAGMSKKVFKRALGVLLKSGEAVAQDYSCSLR